MNAPLRPASRLIVAMTLASCGLGALASAQTVRYAIDDLGPVDSKQSIASSINDAGVAVGWVQTPASRDTRAARTVRAAFSNSYRASSRWSAEGINAFGDIAGS